MHSDKPVTDQASDRFQRYNFAKRIAETILNLPTKDSLCIGLYGQWGEGKTSVIEFVSRELAQKAVIVRFNPWQSTSDQVLLSYFFDELADSLEIQIEGWRDKAAKLVQSYGAILSTVPYMSKDVTDTLGKIISKTTLASQRKAVISALLEADQPVVVFVDDIDRLALSEIQAVFKLVKSVADFPNVIYVLALDPDRVAEALKPIFGDGQGYLEKIIQVPLTLPKVQYAALRQYTYEQINQAINQPTLAISEEELRFFKANYEKHLANFVQLPRDPARIGNSIMFALPMLNGEVHMGDLMLLETIKVLLPDLYSSIRNSRSVYLSTYSTYGYATNYQENENKKTQAKKLIDSHLAYLSDADRQTIFPLLEELFPQLETLYRNVAYASDERYKQWHQQKRLCSGHHFDRYFTYAVIEGQISDVLFADLVSTLASKSLEPVVTHFEKNLVGLDVSDFIFKLHFYDGAFSAEQAAQMARVLCRLGEKFYIKNDLIFNVAHQAVSVIKKYIALQSQFDREGLAVQLIELIEPVALALDLHDVLHEEGRRDDDTTPVLTSGQLSSVEQVLFKRLLTKVEQMALFTELEEGDLRRFFYALIRNGHDAAELRERTSRLLDDSQTFGLKLLRIMSPTIHVSHLNQKVPTRNQIKTELSNDDYNLLWSLVSVDKLYHHTVRHYGKQHYIRKESSSYSELSEMELIGQFQQMHDKYINKSESTQPTD